jgi:hypothetical protein
MQDFSATAIRISAEGEVPFSVADRGVVAGSRRITADSFRRLTSRLKKSAVIPDLAVDLQAALSLEEPPQASVDTLPAPGIEPESTPSWTDDLELRPVADLPALPIDGLELPRFIPLEVAASPAPEPSVLPAGEESFDLPLPETASEEIFEPPFAEGEELAAVTLPAAATVDEASDSGPEVTPEFSGSEPEHPEFPDFGVVEAQPAPPAFEDDDPPVQHVEPAIAEIVEPLLVEPDMAALHRAEAESPVIAEAVHMPEAEPRPHREVEVTPAAPGAAARAPKGDTPLADKVVEALVKTVSEAVYAKPTAAERAAFLREVAELVERGEADPVVVHTPNETETTAEASPPAPVRDNEPEAPVIGTSIAEKLGSDSPLLRKTENADPFASPLTARFMPARPTETPEADEDTGELALSLLEMMSGGAASSQPQERALAADTLLRLIPRIPARQLLAIAERVAIMEQPPSLLVARLIRDPRPEIAAPLLERCMHISDHDLMLAATEGDVQKQRMTARRRVISPTLSDQLIARGDTSVILTLVRNPGAALNHDAFYRLAEHAIQHQSVLAPLTTRADLPAPVAFELFWHVPQELRRFIFSRFLTDSENLNRILKITLATQQSPGEGGLISAESRFPPREAVDEAVDLFASGSLDRGAAKLADIAGVVPETALRAVADRDGEPLAVILKALGYPRGKFGDALAKLQKSEVQLVDPNRKLEDLQRIFETLSFNKARILLTYWDWFMRKSGPYAPHN